MCLETVLECLTDHKGHQLLGDGGGVGVHQQESLPAQRTHDEDRVRNRLLKQD